MYPGGGSVGALLSNVSCCGTELQTIGPRSRGATTGLLALEVPSVLSFVDALAAVAAAIPWVRVTGPVGLGGLTGGPPDPLPGLVNFTETFTECFEDLPIAIPMPFAIPIPLAFPIPFDPPAFDVVGLGGGGA